MVGVPALPFAEGEDVRVDASDADSDISADRARDARPPNAGRVVIGILRTFS